MSREWDVVLTDADNHHIRLRAESVVWLSTGEVEFHEGTTTVAVFAPGEVRFAHAADIVTAVGAQ